jgi:hypothetical protein
VRSVESILYVAGIAGDFDHICTRWLSDATTWSGPTSSQRSTAGASDRRPDVAIRTYIDAHNQRCEPFTWTTTADDIIARLKPQTTSATAH